MLKMKFFALLLVVATLSLTTGCTVIREYQPREETLTVKKQEYELAKKLLQAFIKNDAETFVSLLPEEMRTKFDVKSFNNLRKNVIASVGEPIEYSYVTSLELSALNPQIWKVRFRRYNVNRTKEYTSEVLFKVITGMINDKEAVVTGFHFL